jgi:hypothetical protein
MDKVMEFVKKNKKVVIKRALFTVGAIAGLAIIGGLLAKNRNEDDYDEFDDETGYETDIPSEE